MNTGNSPSGDARQRYEDFVNRYRQGPQGISEQEAATHYQQVAPQLPPADYLRAAQEAFARMSPQERAEFGRYMAQEAQRQGHDFIDLNQDGIDDRLQDPDYLARTTAQVHEQEPGLLAQLFGGTGHGGGGGGHTGGGGPAGGGAGGMLNSPLAKGVLGGIAAYGLSRMLGGHKGGLFGGHHGGHHGHRRHGDGLEVDDLFEGGGFFGGEDE